MQLCGPGDSDPKCDTAINDIIFQDGEQLWVNC